MVNHDTSFPPHRIHSTARLSQSDALSLLSSYLSRAETDPSLHPNAILSESGPTVPYTGASSTGLVLHNLKRLEAGLDGRHIAADLGEDGHLAQGATALHRAEAQQSRNADGGMDLDWQTMSEFERDERDVDEGMGPEPPGSGIMDEGEEARVLGFSQTGQANVDKKQAKRARKQELKRQREDARRKAAAAAVEEAESNGEDEMGDTSSSSS